ncbi:hypothetical protein HN385_04340 [archaeon]|jgi:hypothetical protein|nr:hypothetical protein [archaeon]MBT3451448.1 hypothetical protein [archaeon]MBT6868972.1 hypothetical protein [archaeon]MBT7193238.1 hypothetical protein [archaeon]MBT7380093.1 hypothetical protein [archaeon]
MNNQNILRNIRKLPQGTLCMKMEGINRVVDYLAPDGMTFSRYLVDAKYAGNISNLNKDELIELLEEKTSLVDSEVDYQTQRGFNDPNIMGVEEADKAKFEECSNVWVGVDGYTVELQLLPKVTNNLRNNVHTYAYRILNEVIAFVEDPSNYKV